MREPRDPLLKVVLIACYRKDEVILHFLKRGLCENASPLSWISSIPKGCPRGGAQKGEMDFM